MHAPHLVREHERAGRGEPQPQLGEDERGGEEPRARQPGVALEAPPRPRLAQRFAAAFAAAGAAAGAGASATASVVPGTLPACAASATYRW